MLSSCTRASPLATWSQRRGQSLGWFRSCRPSTGDRRPHPRRCLATPAKSVRVDEATAGTSKWHGSGDQDGDAGRDRDHWGSRRGGGRPDGGLEFWKFPVGGGRMTDRAQWGATKADEGDWGCSANLSRRELSSGPAQFWERFRLGVGVDLRPNALVPALCGRGGILA